MPSFSVRKPMTSPFIQGNLFGIQIFMTYKLGGNLLDDRKIPTFNTPSFLPEVSRYSWHGKRKRLPETRKVINKILERCKDGAKGLEGAQRPVMTSLVWPWDGNKWSLAG